MAPARVVRPASVALACVVAVMLALAAPHAPHWDQGAHATPGMPAAAAAAADVSAKFDDGFYDDVQRWIAEAASAGPSGAQGTANSEPELEVLVGGRAAGPVVDLAASAGAATVSLRTTDAEGDTVTLSMRVLEASMAAGAVASSPPALTDHGNGTATLTVDGSAAGEYLVELTAADAHGEEWGVYLVRVAPGAGLP